MTHRRTLIGIACGAGLLIAIAVGWWAKQDYRRPVSQVDNAVAATPEPSDVDAAELSPAGEIQTTEPEVVVLTHESSDARQALAQEPIENHARIHGVVADRAGSPLINARVQLTTVNGGGHFDFARTDTEGLFSFVNVAADSYRLVATLRKLNSEPVQVTIDAKDPVVEQDLTITKLQRIAVDWVLSDGTPVHDELERTDKVHLFSMSEVFAAPARPSAPGKARVGDRDNGRFQPARDPGRGAPIERLGTISISADQADVLHLVVWGHTVASVPITYLTSEVEFVVSLEDLLAARSGICFQVTSAATGEPLAAEVRFDASSSLSRTTFAQEYFSDGRVLFTELVAGKNNLDVSAEGFATTSRLVTLTAGETLDLGIIALHAPASFGGRVRIDYGAKTECMVRAGHEQADGAIHWGNYERTRNNGVFGFTGIEPGRWAIQAFFPFDPVADGAQGLYRGMRPGRMEFHSLINFVETDDKAAQAVDLELGQQ